MSEGQAAVFLVYNYDICDTQENKRRFDDIMK